MGRRLVGQLVTLLERLRAMVEAVPPGGLVTLSRDWLANELRDPAAPVTNADLTIAQVAASMGRAASTVRGWLERGELKGYRFRNREWRIPPVALEAFIARERAGPDQSTARTSIGDWRSVGKNAKVGPTQTGGAR